MIRQTTCERCACLHTYIDTNTHLRGLKWRGSERSRGGLGSRARAALESSSAVTEEFWDRPGRVVDEEAGFEAQSGSKERLSGGL